MGSHIYQSLCGSSGYVIVFVLLLVFFLLLLFWVGVFFFISSIIFARITVSLFRKCFLGIFGEGIGVKFLLQQVF